MLFCFYRFRFVPVFSRSECTLLYFCTFSPRSNSSEISFQRSVSLGDSSLLYLCSPWLSISSSEWWASTITSMFSTKTNPSISTLITWHLTAAPLSPVSILFLLRGSLAKLPAELETAVTMVGYFQMLSIGPFLKSSSRTWQLPSLSTNLLNWEIQRRKCRKKKRTNVWSALRTSRQLNVKGSILRIIRLSGIAFGTTSSICTISKN